MTLSSIKDGTGKPKPNRFSGFSLLVVTSILLCGIPSLTLQAAEQVTGVTITSVAPSSPSWITSLPQSVTINFTCSSDGVESDVAYVGYIDAVSGIRTTTASASPVTCDGTQQSGSISMQFATNDGYHTALARVCKQISGNCLEGLSSSQATKFPVDTSAPNDVSGLSSSSHPVGGWSNKQTISLNWVPAVDNGPSGIAGYSIDCGAGAASPDSVVDTSGTSHSVTMFEGANIFCAVRTKDNAGHWTNTAQVGPFKIDTTPPMITGAIAEFPNAKGWFNTPVTVNFSCQDTASGVASVTPSSIVSANAINQSVNGTCTDIATNSASTVVTGINIDTIAPILTVISPTPDATYLFGESIRAEWTTSDNMTMVSVISSSATSGQFVDTSRVGDLVFSITISDDADNTTSVEIPYHVRYDIQPMGPDGSFLVEPAEDEVKIGSTVVSGRFEVGEIIQLRFGIADAEGNPVPNLKPTMNIVSVSINGDEETTTALPRSWQFDYDASSNEYFLDLDSAQAGLKAGIYDLWISFGDESTHRVRIVIEDP